MVFSMVGQRRGRADRGGRRRRSPGRESRHQIAFALADARAVRSCPPCAPQLPLLRLARQVEDVHAVVLLELRHAFCQRTSNGDVARAAQRQRRNVGFRPRRASRHERPELNERRVAQVAEMVHVALEQSSTAARPLLMHLTMPRASGIASHESFRAAAGSDAISMHAPSVRPCTTMRRRTQTARALSPPLAASLDTRARLSPSRRRCTLFWRRAAGGGRWRWHARSERWPVCGRGPCPGDAQHAHARIDAFTRPAGDAGCPR